MKTLFALALFGISSSALAHPGHLSEAAGHTHWLALAAVGAAVAVACVALLRGISRRRRQTAR